MQRVEENEEDHSQEWRDKSA